MDLLETVVAHARAMKRPLAAVTITAIPRVDTPLLVLLHWHGFGRAGPAPGAPLRPLPISALQVNERWRTVESVEHAVLDAAWRCGAWDLERIEQRSCDTIGAPARETLECWQAFGEYRRGHDDDDAAAAGERLLDEAAPDRAQMQAFGARYGFVRWLFRPVRDGLWGSVADDATLAADGSREPPCPVAIEPLRRPWRRARTVYRFGVGRGLWLPGPR